MGARFKEMDNPHAAAGDKGVWGLRLVIRTVLRGKVKEEDFRYQKWRKERGKYFLWRS